MNAQQRKFHKVIKHRTKAKARGRAGVEDLGKAPSLTDTRSIDQKLADDKALADRIKSHKGGRHD